MKIVINNVLIGASFLLISQSALAATLNVQVKTSITGICQMVNAGDATIDFGNLTAISGDQSKTATAKFWCSTGTVFHVTANDGANAQATQKRMKSGTFLLPYALDFTPKTGTGTGKANAIDLTMTASLKGSDLEAATVANNYLDTVVITITP